MAGGSALFDVEPGQSEKADQLENYLAAQRPQMT